MAGPFGYIWEFSEHEYFESEYPDYFEEFLDLVYTEDPSASNYNNSYDDYDSDY